MCTVVVELRPGASTRLLAVRDEDPARPWDGPGAWWPEAYPGVIGVRDRRANGAWLATAQDPARLAVILNRAPAEDSGDADPRPPLESRGAIVLDAVRGARVPDQPRTGPFNLVEATADSVVVTSWDGVAVHRTTLGPGYTCWRTTGSTIPIPPGFGVGCRSLPRRRRTLALPTPAARAGWRCSRAAPNSARTTTARSSATTPPTATRPAPSSCASPKSAPGSGLRLRPSRSPASGARLDSSRPRIARRTGHGFSSVLGRITGVCCGAARGIFFCRGR
ncbi:hypothetical protein G7067_11020 [Leucobacter insecticola]|uniref:NRDE family protein n=1 Tax=Leucobacter insecticola TaxID=2714934 RepID=A0A6G8FKC5_9MICO|nr:hypothetical protein G7067_11020 [Leucobacter insecticola]